MDDSSVSIYLRPARQESGARLRNSSASPLLLTIFTGMREIADTQHLSVDEVIASAPASYMAVAGWERLKQRAARGRHDTFAGVFEKVPDVDPEDYDFI